MNRFYVECRCRGNIEIDIRGKTIRTEGNGIYIFSWREYVKIILFTTVMMMYYRKLTVVQVDLYRN